MRFLILALFAAGCASNTAGDPSTPNRPDPVGVSEFESEEDYRQERAETAAELDAAITPATASDVASCRVVPTSEQACGGPTSFAVFSSERPDAAEVERLAARLVALDIAANRQFGWASTCMAYAPPVPILRNGECASDRD